MEVGEPLDIAAVLRNQAVCYISLNEFTRAQDTYVAAREHCTKYGFSLLVAEADYNVAYLHYLRGEYLRAIELYDQTRVLCQKLGDRFHMALCDLDQSEIYLELNLTEGGEELARAAFNAFTELGMKYEAAKAATFSAIAISQQGHHLDSLLIFDEARELFVKEQNQLWPALIDLYKALVMWEAEENDKAEDLAHAALEYFGESVLPGKAALCELLLAALSCVDLILKRRAVIAVRRSHACCTLSPRRHIRPISCWDKRKKPAEILNSPARRMKRRIANWTTCAAISARRTEDRVPQKQAGGV